MCSVRCRAYSGLSGLESGKAENKSDDHELEDDDDVVDDSPHTKFVRNLFLHTENSLQQLLTIVAVN